MSLFTKLLLYALLATFATCAKAHQVETGTGVICDTQVQIEKYALNRSEETLQAINAEAAHACAYLTVAFIPGETVNTLKNEHVVAILVVAFHNGRGWVNLKPLVQYSLFAIPGEGA